MSFSILLPAKNVQQKRRRSKTCHSNKAGIATLLPVLAIDCSCFAKSSHAAVFTRDFLRFRRELP